MEIKNEKVRRLDMDELEQVSGGRVIDAFGQGRIASLFSGGDETKTTDTDQQTTTQYKPPVLKA